jgi:hypothetical protein
MLSSLSLIPVQKMLPAALAAILERAPLSQEKVAFAWRAAVGPAIDNVSSVELRDAVLRVTVRDVRWQREIEHSAGLIRSRLQPMLGDGVVRSIQVLAAE